MNKPPEKIRVVIDKDFYTYTTNKAVNELNSKLQCLAPFTEHFYTLEKPMTQKTENLTTEEAWAAMARGEFIQTKREIYYLLNSCALRYWDGQFWVSTSVLERGPYSIVPDPSKPKEVKSNYQEQVMAIDAMLKRGEYKNAAACILTYVDSLYLRKP